MKVNEAARRLVAEFEGFSGRAYQCPAGVWTIGYGFTAGVQPGDTITREQAEARLDRELAEFGAGVARLLTRPATPNQFGAMASLAFNVGLAAFARSSVLRLHNAGDFEAAARAFHLWNRAGGRVLRGLVRRRAAEAALYLTPEVPLQPVERMRVDVPEAEPVPVEIDTPPPLPMPQKIDPERPLTESRIIRGAGVSGGIAGLTLAAEGARAVGEIRWSLGDWLPYVALAAVVIGAGYVIYQRFLQRRRGEA